MCKFIHVLHLWYFLCCQGRSRIAALGRAVIGGSRDRTNWRVTTGNTPGPSLSSVSTATAVSPDRTTWRYTWRDTPHHRYDLAEIALHSRLGVRGNLAGVDGVRGSKPALRCKNCVNHHWSCWYHTVQVLFIIIGGLMFQHSSSKHVDHQVKVI